MFPYNRILVKAEKPVKQYQTLQLSSGTHTNEIFLGLLEATQMKNTPFNT